MRSPSQEERLVHLMDYLQQHQRITVSTICELFHVSRDTARRDIVKLVDNENVIRTHGGVMLPHLTKGVVGYKERLKLESDGKRKIAQVASSLVKDEDYVIFDASTTVHYTAQCLEAKNITVVTNAIDVANILADKDSTIVQLLGGTLNGKHHFLHGISTLQKLAEYQVNKLFIGACGITADGLSYPNEEDGAVKREMIRHADQVIVLADSTKFGKRLFHRISGLETIDVIITNKQPNEEIAQILSDHGIDLIIANEQANDN